MAIADVLWGCPLCRLPAGLRRDHRRERCTRCGAEFRRGQGALVIARHDGRISERSVAEWLNMLGEPCFAPDPDTGVMYGPENVQVRIASSQRPLYHAGELIGFIEVFGPRLSATLTLYVDRLVFQPDAGGEPFTWPLSHLTVVQPASSDLQVAAGPVVASIRFPHSSARLWTRAIVTALRGFHGARGCDVVEFQPLIRTRPAVNNA